MRRIASRIFKTQRQVKIIAGTDEYFGRGIISKSRSVKTDFMDSERLRLGEFPKNLCVFIGDCESLRESIGEILTCGDMSYRILSAETVTAGDIEICDRAVLEKTAEETAYDK